MAWLGMNDDEVNAQGHVLQKAQKLLTEMKLKIDQEVSQQRLTSSTY